MKGILIWNRTVLTGGGVAEVSGESLFAPGDRGGVADGGEGGDGGVRVGVLEGDGERAASRGRGVGGRPGEAKR